MKTLSKKLIDDITALWNHSQKTKIERVDIEKLSVILNKLNYEIEPLNTAPDKIAMERAVLPGLTAFIQKFVEKEVTHPPKVAPSFPSDELAARLVKIYGVKGAQ